MYPNQKFKSELASAYWEIKIYPQNNPKFVRKKKSVFQPIRPKFPVLFVQPPSKYIRSSNGQISVHTYPIIVYGYIFFISQISVGYSLK